MTKQKKKDIIFICKKCGHHLFIIKGKDFVKKIKNKNCPNCGEESDENWIFGGLGYYKETNLRKLN